LEANIHHREDGVAAPVQVPGSENRARFAAQRDETARARDLTALARDRVAEARDHIAETRDHAAEARLVESAGGQSVERALADAMATVRLLRSAGARLRRQAAADRLASATDRERAASDRRQSAVDRRFAGVDDLTGVFRRGTGEVALHHELARARRSGRPLALAMIDVDGLKAVNDCAGHAAGDALLRSVATAIALSLRSYDVTVRWGGDEFVCALSNTTLDDAGRRIEDVKEALHAERPDASLSVGVAALQPDDSLEDLVSRSDGALYLVKGAGRA
jgi:diguanylate cyclase (GGDEF)-like protein